MRRRILAVTDESFERATIVVMCSSAAAIVAAIMLGYVARYDFGLSREQISNPRRNRRGRYRSAYRSRVLRQKIE